ncbi:sensor histidine kinase [Cryptosporangium japonicum]
MVLQAGALRVSAEQPQTQAAADAIRETGAQALTELREVIGLLREPPATLLAAAEVGEAPPGRLSALVTESGVRAVLVEDGDPGRVPAVVGRAAYRVVQEGLTNVRKHAPGAAATVTLGYGPDGVRVSVRNGPAASTPDPALVGSGTGLLGLRERVELLGGSLDSGPCDGGGFLLEARLPA